MGYDFLQMYDWKITYLSNVILEWHLTGMCFFWTPISNSKTTLGFMNTVSLVFHHFVCSSDIDSTTITIEHKNTVRVTLTYLFGVLVMIYMMTNQISNSKTTLAFMNTVSLVCPHLVFASDINSTSIKIDPKTTFRLQLLQYFTFCMQLSHLLQIRPSLFYSPITTTICVLLLDFHHFIQE